MIRLEGPTPRRESRAGCQLCAYEAAERRKVYTLAIGTQVLRFCPEHIKVLRTALRGTIV